MDLEEERRAEAVLLHDEGKLKLTLVGGCLCFRMLGHMRLERHRRAFLRLSKKSGVSWQGEVVFQGGRGVSGGRCVRRGRLCLPERREREVGFLKGLMC